MTGVPIVATSAFALSRMRGTIVQLTHRRSFKLAVVLGASRVEGKVRVCVWSDNSRTWSNATTQKVANLREIVESDFPAGSAGITARHRAVYRRAFAAKDARS